MRGTLQMTALVIVLVLALLADGLMDTLGMAGFSITAGIAILIAWVLIELSDHCEGR